VIVGLAPGTVMPRVKGEDMITAENSKKCFILFGVIGNIGEKNDCCDFIQKI
jgi:hypothetical protein